MHAGDAVASPGRPTTVRRYRNIVTFRRMGFQCPKTARSILSSVSFITRPKGAATVVKDAKYNGSALIGLLPHFCSIANKRVALSKASVHGCALRSLQRRVKFMPRGKVLFSNAVTDGLHFKTRSTSSRRVQRTTRVTRTARFVSDGRSKCRDTVTRNKDGISNKRGRQLTVTETVTGGPGVCIFSSDFSTLSVGASTTLHETLRAGARRAAIVVITRQVDAVLRTSRVLMLSSKGVIKGNARRRLLRGYRICRRVTEDRLSTGRLKLSRRIGWSNEAACGGASQSSKQPKREGSTKEGTGEFRGLCQGANSLSQGVLMYGHYHCSFYNNICHLFHYQAGNCNAYGRYVNKESQGGSHKGQVC